MSTIGQPEGATQRNVSRSLRQLFCKSPEIHGGPLSCNVLQNLVFAKSPPAWLGMHLGIWHHFKPLVRFHFPVSPSFFYLLFVPPTGGLSLC